jgi:hypothetical protein
MSMYNKHFFYHLKTLFCKTFFYSHLDLDLFYVLYEHCFICRPSDFTVLEDAGIEPRNLLWHWKSDALTAQARFHGYIRQDLILIHST